MAFRIYDLVSLLVPGYILYIAIFHFAGIPYDRLSEMSTIALAFVLGYANNTISSWIEDFLYWTWRGKPSSNLLDGKSIWKVHFYHHVTTKKRLLGESANLLASNDELFQIAYRNVASAKSCRVQDFNESYAFSRSILVCCVIASVLINIKYWPSSILLLCSIIAILSFWLRSKQKAYYYAKEVLDTYMGRVKKGNNAEDSD